MSNIPPPPHANNPYGQGAQQGSYSTDQPYGQGSAPQFLMQQDLPNASIILVLGILSIVFCLCWGFIGLICGIIALLLANKELKKYEQSPHSFSIRSYNNAKAGKTCAIIGIVLSIIAVIVFFALDDFSGKAIGFSGNSFMNY
jgi:hypothetical protein